MGVLETRNIVKLNGTASHVFESVMNSSTAPELSPLRLVSKPGAALMTFIVAF